MRKPAFCISENKGADQLCGKQAADQRFCFRCTDSTIPHPKFQASSNLLWLVPDLVGSPEDRFSREAAHLVAPQGV